MKVRGLGDENFFEEISISKAVNRHSVCKFKQRLAEENFHVFQNAVGKTISVALDDGRKVFFGDVTEVSIEQTFSGSHVEVTAISSSLKSDEFADTRIFQSPVKTFGDVLNSSRLKLKNCSIELDEKISLRPCPEIVLQNAETAFEFVKRLASWQGRRIWVRDTWQGKCVLKISACSDETPEKISTKEIIRLKIGQCGKIRTAELVATKYVELGRILTVGNVSEKFLIVGLEIFLEHGIDRIRYKLEEFAELEPAEICAASPVKLKARVVDVKDEKNFGRVRVQFEIEDKDADKAWLPYRSPYNGIIFLPEVGDTVEVFFTKDECYVATILRTKALEEPFHNIADKYLVNREQRIFFREKSLEFKSAKTSIFMDEKKIVMIAGTNKIILDENGITLQTGGKVTAEVAKNFSTKIGGTVTTEIAKDFSAKIGGTVTINASGNVALNGEKFEVTASGVAAIKGSSVKLG